MKKQFVNIKVLAKSKSFLIHLIMYVLAIATITPFFWMILTSVKDMSEIFAYPPKWFPTQIKLQNYVDAFNAAPFGKFYLNSLTVAAAVTMDK